MKKPPALASRRFERPKSQLTRRSAKRSEVVSQAHAPAGDGFAEAFASGNVGPDTFAQGIWQALITTAYGLIVAIPSLLLYRFLQGRTGRIVAEMEEDAMGIVNLLEDSRRGRVRAETGAPAGEPAR